MKNHIITVTLIWALVTSVSAVSASPIREGSNLREYNEFQDALKDLDNACLTDPRCSRLPPKDPPTGVNEQGPFELFCIMFPRSPLCSKGSSNGNNSSHLTQ